MSCSEFSAWDPTNNKEKRMSFQGINKAEREGRLGCYLVLGPFLCIQVAKVKTNAIRNCHGCDFTLEMENNKFGEF